ncbi:MAG: GNAT family N-acetyltransferase [Rhodocyclaceae bacterium]|nr:GNAT family N-acetyltransferase [Rhodocyclaceae bacterium]
MASRRPDVILGSMSIEATSVDTYRVRPGRAEDLRQIQPEMAEAIQAALVEPGKVRLTPDERACVVASVEAAFSQALRDVRQSVLVGEGGGRVCGFAIVDRSERVPDLRWIVVLPSRLGGGLAQALLDEAVGLCPDDAPLSLVVAAGNQRAIRFFRRNRFVEGPSGAGVCHILRMRRMPVSSRPAADFPQPPRR